MAVLTFITESYRINIQNSFTLLGHFRMIREPIQSHPIVVGDNFYFLMAPILQVKQFAEAWFIKWVKELVQLNWTWVGCVLCTHQLGPPPPFPVAFSQLPRWNFWLKQHWPLHYRDCCFCLLEWIFSPYVLNTWCLTCNLSRWYILTTKCYCSECWSGTWSSKIASYLRNILLLRLKVHKIQDLFFLQQKAKHRCLI